MPELDIFKQQYKVRFKDAPADSFATKSFEHQRYKTEMSVISTDLTVVLPFLFEGKFEIYLWVEHIDEESGEHFYRKHTYHLHTKDFLNRELVLERVPRVEWSDGGKMAKIIASGPTSALGIYKAFAASLPEPTPDETLAIDKIFEPPKPLIKIGKEHLPITLALLITVIMMNIKLTHQFDWFTLIAMAPVSLVLGWHIGFVFFRWKLNARTGD